MKCVECKYWIQIRKTVYDGGSEIVNWESSSKDEGYCDILKIETKGDFGCLSFEIGDHEEITHKTGEPWHHYILINCPDCEGRGSLIEAQRHCGRCVGTGNVPKYDDGYISDQRTREHPKNKSRARGRPRIDDEPEFSIKQSESAKRSIV